MIWQRLRRIPWATFLLLLIQILVFIWETLNGGSLNSNTLIRAGAKLDVLLVQGQWWRLVSPIFVHIGWEHLLINSLTLYFLGMGLEPLYGSGRFLVIYLLSGVGGNLCSFALGNLQSVSAGASTSLFGLFGLYVALGVIFRNNPAVRQWSRQFLVLIVLNLVFDLFLGQIDIWGHIGGAIFGFLLGTVVAKQQFLDAIPTRWRIINTIVLVIIAVTLYQIGVRRI